MVVDAATATQVAVEIPRQLLRLQLDIDTFVVSVANVRDKSTGSNWSNETEEAIWWHPMKLGDTIESR